MASRKRWLCLDCGIDTGKAREHYFVHSEVWSAAGMGKCGMLCVGCLSERLGRALTAQDFPRVHINNPRLYPMSDRLRAALTG